MAKMWCKCGEILRDDTPDWSFFLLSRREFDVDKDSTLLFGQARLVIRCPACGRLWVFWDDRVAIEYALVDPHDDALS